MCDYWEAAYHELDARFEALARKYDEEDDALEKRINAIAEHYGYEHQRIKCIEELAELTQALARGDKQEILWESADVVIMIQQILYLLKLNNKSAIESKVARQERRIKEEHTDCSWK